MVLVVYQHLPTNYVVGARKIRLQAPKKMRTRRNCFYHFFKQIGVFLLTRYDLWLC